MSHCSEPTASLGTLATPGTEVVDIARKGGVVLLETAAQKHSIFTAGSGVPGTGSAARVAFVHGLLLPRHELPRYLAVSF